MAKIHVYVDASVRPPNIPKAGMSYAWAAFDETGRVLKSKVGLIPAGLNPSFNNNIAEAIALFAAQAARQLGECEFFTDSKSVVDMVHEKGKPRLAILKRITTLLRGMPVQFANKNPFTYMVDHNAKCCLRGMRLLKKPAPLPPAQRA